MFSAPSLRGESFGVVLIEAMSAGTAVVASGIDGYRNVATDGEDALLVPPGDDEALAGALRRVLADDALGVLAARCRRPPGADFAMPTLADEYVRIYRELIAARAAEVRPSRWWRRSGRRCTTGSPRSRGGPRTLAAMTIALIIIVVVVVLLVVWLIRPTTV